MKKLFAFGLILVLLGFDNVAIQDDCKKKKIDSNYLKSRFLYKDSIVVDYDNNVSKSISVLQQLDSCLEQKFANDFSYVLKLTKTRGADSPSISKLEFDKLSTDTKSSIFCYSIRKMVNGNHAVVLVGEGHYLPELVLIFYDSKWNFKNGTILRSQFVDAGEVEIYKSKLKDKDLFVSYVTQYETHEKGYGESIIDSTVNSWRMTIDGILLKGGKQKFKRRVKWP